MCPARKDMEPVSIPVVYVGGFAGHAPRGGLIRQSWHEAWNVIFQESGVSITKKPNKVLAQSFVVRAEGWADVDVHFEDSQSRPDVVAIALVGVFGLSSQQQTTLITVTFGDGAVQLLAYTPVYQFRTLIDELSKSYPDSVGHLHLEQPPGREPERSQQMDTLEGIERASRLLEKGVLTTEEFDRIKHDMLAKLERFHESTPDDE